MLNINCVSGNTIIFRALSPRANLSQVSNKIFKEFHSFHPAQGISNCGIH